MNGSFLLVSLGHGIKRTIAITRAGARFAVREPVRELVKQGRERMEQALSTDTFEHDGQRVQLTDEERCYLEHEIAAHESGVSQPTTAAAEPTDPAAWMAELEAGLSPDEEAKLEKMKKGKTPEEQRAMFQGDLEASREKVRAALRAEQEAAAMKAQSKARVDELKKEIVDKGLMSEPEIRAIVDDASKKPRDKIPALRDKLMARLLEVEAQAAHPNAQVFDGVKIYEKLPETTFAEWEANHPGEKPMASPAGRMAFTCSAASST